MKTIRFASIATGANRRISAGVQIRTLLIVAEFVVCFFLGARAQAQTQPQATASVFFVHGESGGPTQQSSGTYYTLETYTDPDADFVYYGNGAASVVSGPGGVKTNVPSLHALANASTPGNDEGVFAQASFDDPITFAASLTNDPINLFTFNFSVSGTLTGNATANFDGSVGSTSFGYTLSSGTQNIAIQVPSSALTYGLNANNQPTYSGTFSVMLSTSVNNNNGIGGTNTSDFSDTVELTEVDATDANGNQVDGTFTDNDALSFAANTPLPNQTPEPATWAMMLASLALLGISVRCKLV